MIPVVWVMDFKREDNHNNTPLLVLHKFLKTIEEVNEVEKLKQNNKGKSDDRGRYRSRTTVNSNDKFCKKLITTINKNIS